MKARMLSFGRIEIDGKRYQHDVVIDGSTVRKRKKGPSKPLRDRFGHTPLSVDERIPWAAKRLVIGTGMSGQLPIMPEVEAEARKRRVKLIVKPSPEACELLSSADDGEDIAAILHVTC